MNENLPFPFVLKVTIDPIKQGTRNAFFSSKFIVKIEE
jgi:hypothetical protein